MTLRLVKHPSIINLYKVYEDSTFVYMVTEYVPGGDLAKKILREGKMSENDAKSLIRGLADTLVYFKQSGVMYKNLSATNILMGNSRNSSDFKLCDFGKSVILRESRTGLFADEEADYADDMYSLGIILNIALTGRFSFNKHQDTYRFLGKHALSTEVQNVIDQLTQDNPKKRPDPEDFFNFQWVKTPSNINPHSNFDQTLEYLRTTMNQANFETYLRMMGLSNEEDADIDDDDVQTGIVLVHQCLKPGAMFKSA